MFSDTLRIFYQDSNGLFQNYSTLHLDYSSINSIDISDINNDGFTDIVFSGKKLKENFINILYQQSNATFIKKSYKIPFDTIHARNLIPKIKVANINNDCYKDIVLISPGFLTVLYLNMDSTKNKFVTKRYLLNGDYHYWNNLAIGTYGKGSKKNIFVTIDKNLSFIHHIDIDTSGIISDSYTSFDGGEVPENICINDLDNDGLNEIIVVNNFHKLTIYNQASNSKYNQTIFESVPYPSFNPNSMEVGDVNNDGLPDIVNCRSLEYFRVHYNTTSPKFPILNYPKIVFHDCQNLKTDTIFKNTFFEKTKFDTLGGCNKTDVEQYKFTKKYLIRSGIGDSLYYNTFCFKNPVYIKKNIAISDTNFYSNDTTLSKIISSNITLPIFNYTFSGVKEICESTELNLAFQKNSSFDYKSKWYWNKDSLDANMFKINGLASGVYEIPTKVYYKDAKVYCSKYDTVQIKVNANPNDISIVGQDTLCEGQKSVSYQSNSSENINYVWTVSGADNKIFKNQNAINLDILSSTPIVLNAQGVNTNGCFGNVTKKNVFVRKIDDCISIPNIFTPNKDGINDLFDIKKIELYPENNLKIYNRWAMSFS